MGMNFVVLAGRMTSDPELKYTQAGKAFAKFSIAIARTYNRDEVDFINCTAWGKTAEVAGEYLKKGSLIGVQGSLRVSQYEQDGQKRNRTEVQVNSLEFLDSKKSSTQLSGSVKDSDNFDEYVETKSGEPDDDFPF
jgi:single-strand DNA-binding protein